MIHRFKSTCQNVQCVQCSERSHRANIYHEVKRGATADSPRSEKYCHMDLDRYINMAKPFFKSLFKKKNSKPPPSPPSQSDEVFGSRAWGRQWSQKHTKEKRSSQIHYKVRFVGFGCHFLFCVVLIDIML